MVSWTWEYGREPLNLQWPLYLRMVEPIFTIVCLLTDSMYVVRMY